MFRSACCTSVTRSVPEAMGTEGWPPSPSLAPVTTAAPVPGASSLRVASGPAARGGTGDLFFVPMLATEAADTVLVAAAAAGKKVADEGQHSAPPLKEEACEEPEGEAEDFSARGPEGEPPPMTAEQHREAKKVINTFVKEMVKGRQMSVVTKSGGARDVSVSLSRRLDSMTVQAGGSTRQIKLEDIDEIMLGEDGPTIDTPLDELCATLALASDEYITFRLPDHSHRDTFAMCLMMFVNGIRGEGE